MIFNGYLIILLALVIWLAYKAAVKLLAYATVKSQFRQSLWTCRSTQPWPNLMTGLKCPTCGSTGDKPTIHLFSNPVQKCDQCDDYTTTPSGLHAILHHFFAEPAKNLLGQTIVGIRPHGHDTAPSIVHKSRDGKRYGFDLTALNNLIVQRNRYTIRRMESHWWFPRRLLSAK